jgi:hypothetical protein
MTPEGARWQRAMAQHNLAITLQSLSLSASDAAMRLQLLDIATVAQREALAAMTRDTEPLLWAKLNSNFAKTLRMRGHATPAGDAVAFFRESAARYRTVLEVATRERDPAFWAMNQTALGQVLQALAEAETDPQQAASHLREAAAGQRQLVDAYRQQDKAADWALALHDLGYSLVQLGDRGGGVESYRQAETAYRDEISAYSREAAPIYWARAQAGIGNALRGIGMETRDRQTLVEARRRTEEARAAIQPFDTSYNGILDARIAEIDAALSSLN